MPMAKIKTVLTGEEHKTEMTRTQVLDRQVEPYIRLSLPA